MFAKAYSIAKNFTLPVVISSRSSKGVCRSAIGSCVVVNREGWILTCAHLINEIHRQEQSSLKHRNYDHQVRTKEQDTIADKRFRKDKVYSFHRPSKDTVLNHSVWWGRDGAQLHDVSLMPATDLALGRLQPFDPEGIKHYPVFKKPGENYTPGRSLCKIGFPFHEITPSYDAEKNIFVLPKGSVPLPIFPIEGIFTRVVIAQMPGLDEKELAKQGVSEKEQGMFIETSSPGLVGQSGGPIIDSEGVVWALQSHTRHYPLGFSPPIPGQDPSLKQKEHQFLNVGLGVHAEPILHFMNSRGVKYEAVD